MFKPPDYENLRGIGYANLGLVALFIIIGFVTNRSGWAMAGVLSIFLPVFGNFALSMFFLAGLGILRVEWLALLGSLHPGSWPAKNQVHQG